MSEQNHSSSRRQFLRRAGGGIAVMTVAGSIPLTTARAQEMLSPDDPTAKALGYVEVTAVEGQRCDNCNFWQGGDAAAGGCPIFPGKNVTEAGWCKSWIKKA